MPPEQTVQRMLPQLNLNKQMCTREEVRRLVKSGGGEREYLSNALHLGIEGWRKAATSMDTESVPLP